VDSKEERTVKSQNGWKCRQRSPLDESWCDGNDPSRNNSHVAFARTHQGPDVKSKKSHGKEGSFGESWYNVYTLFVGVDPFSLTNSSKYVSVQR
jgi:hypothetical protein